MEIDVAIIQVKDFLNAFKEELGVYPYSVNCMGSHVSGMGRLCNALHDY